MNCGLCTPRRRIVGRATNAEMAAPSRCEKRTLVGMAALLVFVALLIVLGVAAWRGWLPDTRDPEYSLGKVLQPRGESPARPDNVQRSSPRSSADRAPAF